MAVGLAMAGDKGGGGSVDEGRRLYLTGCSTCHGVEGEGTDRGPSLEEAGAASAYFFLSTGRMPMSEPDEQPRRKPPAYDEDEIDALVAYVATLGDGPEIPEVDPEAGDLAEGNLLYSANCAACHNSAGSGGAAGDFLAPDLYSATPTETAAAVRVGPGAMPRFGEEQLDQEELDSLVRYVEHLDDPTDRGGLPLGRVGPVPEGLVAWIVGLGLLLLVARWIGTRERRA
jgi:ubiquinol-cytochrome c reductase cytochrome c subunit